MSFKSTSRGRPGQRKYGGSFSSMSMGSYIIPKISTGATNVAPITSVTFNRSLLKPLNIEIDPIVHAIRSHETEQIKGLNDNFVTFIDKVRRLEQQNKMLETKWALLQQQSAPCSEVEPMLKSYIAKLQHQLGTLNNDTHRLEMEKQFMINCVEDYRTKYEGEISKRNDAESEFVVLKKEVDTCYVSRMELEKKVFSISEEINFLKALYDVELRELHESLKETSVVVQMDNSRRLNMEKIISEVKAHYEDSFTHSREETESWYQSKFNQRAAEASQYDVELRSTKAEIAALNQMIRRLQNEIQAVKAQEANLRDQIAKAELRGEVAVRDAKARVRDLEMALLRAKQDMARQVREYQELLNVKLALDMEISTYRKLLEGEEEIHGTEPIAFSDTKHPQQRTGTILIKTVEVHGNSYS